MADRCPVCKIDGDHKLSCPRQPGGQLRLHATARPAADSPIYRAVRNTVVDQTGKQLAIVSPVNCSKKLAAELAAYAAQQANHHVRDMRRRTEKTNQPGED